MRDARNAILIYNPRSGRGGSRRAQAVARFCEELRSRGVEVEALETQAPDDATRLTAEAARAGATEIIVSGGDGTINEVLQGLVGTNARLAVWPAGTANVLARALRLPADPKRAAEIIARGETKRIRIGCATAEATGARRYFFLMAGIGLDASIVERTPARLKRRVGEAAFWYSGLEHLAMWHPEPFSIEVDGETFPATFAAVGKSARYGGNLAITPRARLEEPEFEICVVDSRSRLRYLHLLSQAIRGGAPAAEGIRFIKTRRARATGDALVQADGELIGNLPMTFEIAPETIEIITP